MYSTHLERAELGIAFKRELLLDPFTRARVLVVQFHELVGIEDVVDHVADPACLCEVGALPRDGVVFVGAHCVAFWEGSECGSDIGPWVL